MRTNINPTQSTLLSALLSTVLSALLLQGAAVAPAWAAKPEWAGNPGGKKGAEAQNAQGAQTQQPAAPNVGQYFNDLQRQATLQYYGRQQSAGKCPPGLAKKNNGCLPPGQAKQWARGAALPRTVMQYPVPPEVLRRLGNPPAGHQFVRVANDILLIAIGSQMVVDAIEDLMK